MKRRARGVEQSFAVTGVIVLNSESNERHLKTIFNFIYRDRVPYICFNWKAREVAAGGGGGS